MTAPRIVRRPTRVALIRLLNRLLPLRHRYRPLLGGLPPDALLAVPWCGFELPLPVGWLDSFTMFRHVAEGPRCMPELRLAAGLLAGAPEGVVADVGAHVGQFVLWLRAVCDRRVVAFEPDPVARELLGRALSANGVGGVEVMGAACGARAGRVALNLGRVSSVSREAGEGTTGIPQVSLDEALAGRGRVAFLKIDVEGFEAQVLRGAGRVLREDRPSLLVELHPSRLPSYGDDIAAVIELVKDGYDLSLWQFEAPAGRGPVGRLLHRYAGGRGARVPLSTGKFDELARCGPPQVYLMGSAREHQGEP